MPFPDICGPCGGVSKLARAMDASALLAKRPPGDAGVALCASAAMAACAKMLREATPVNIGLVCTIFTRLLANPDQLATMQGASKFASAASAPTDVSADATESMARLARQQDEARAKAEADQKAREEWLAGAGRNRQQPKFGAAPDVSRKPATPEGGGK